MRAYVLAILGAALFALSTPVTLSTPAVSQQIEIGPGGVRVDPYRRHYDGGRCRELRWACTHKEQLGEEGMGNCRRYRENCQGRYWR
jgi:hypothetical protein